MDSQQNFNALLSMASKKMGVTPDQLMSQIKSGKFDYLTKGHSANDLVSLLKNNPKAVEDLLAGKDIDSVVRRIREG